VLKFLYKNLIKKKKKTTPGKQEFFTTRRKAEIFDDNWESARKKGVCLRRRETRVTIAIAIVCKLLRFEASLYSSSVIRRRSVSLGTPGTGGERERAKRTLSAQTATLTEALSAREARRTYARPSSASRGSIPSAGLQPISFSIRTTFFQAHNACKIHLATKLINAQVIFAKDVISSPPVTRKNVKQNVQINSISPFSSARQV